MTVVDRPAPPPRRVRKCKHGDMQMTWVEDSSFLHGGYWNLECSECEKEQSG